MFLYSHQTSGEARVKSDRPEAPPSLRQRMKKIFDQCYGAVVECERSSGQKRCKFFRQLPDKDVCEFQVPLKSADKFL